MIDTLPISTEFAGRLAAFRLKDVPPEVVADAKLILLDTLGAMLAASSPKYSATRILMDFARKLGGRPESSLVGQKFKTSCVNAALVNGTLGYYCDIEPHHVGGILHAPPHVRLATLRAGVARGSSDGKQVDVGGDSANQRVGVVRGGGPVLRGP